ncbi:MAG: hypothetical protein ACFB9M_04290 [Myxococcota bacterium]
MADTGAGPRPERATIEQLAGLLPDYAFEILPDTNHIGTWQHPKVAAYLEHFLKR